VCRHTSVCVVCDAGGDASEIPAVMGRRGPGMFGKDNSGSRKASLHVDVFQQRHNRPQGQAAAAAATKPAGGCVCEVMCWDWDARGSLCHQRLSSPHLAAVTELCH